jgi:hypothetical protein
MMPNRVGTLDPLASVVVSWRMPVLCVVCVLNRPEARFCPCFINSCCEEERTLLCGGDIEEGRKINPIFELFRDQKPALYGFYCFLFCSVNDCLTHHIVCLNDEAVSPMVLEPSEEVVYARAYDPHIRGSSRTVPECLPA